MNDIAEAIQWVLYGIDAGPAILGAGGLVLVILGCIAWFGK
jgi:hypothetical protein